MCGRLSHWSPTSKSASLPNVVAVPRQGGSNPESIGLGVFDDMLHIEACSTLAATWARVDEASMLRLQTTIFDSFGEPIHSVNLFIFNVSFLQLDLPTAIPNSPVQLPAEFVEMDVLRKNAEAELAIFEGHLPDDDINPNGSPPKPFKAFHLDTRSGKVVCQRLQLPSDRLGSFLESGSPMNQQPVRRGGDGSPSDGGVVGNHRIKFVLVKARWYFIVEDTGKRLFRELVAASGFDWSLVTILIGQWSVGYFHTGQLNDDNGMSFCLHGLGFMSSLWTTRRTGTCLESRGVIFTEEEDDFDGIMDNFAECEMECYSPLAVHFLLASLQLNGLRADTDSCQSSLSGVEKTTGIWAGNPESILVDGHRIQGGITQILKLSWEVGNVSIGINNCLAQLEEGITAMLRHMGDLASHIPDKEKSKKVRDAEKEIFDGAKVLTQQFRGIKAAYDYLQHRAQLQKDIVSWTTDTIVTTYTSNLK